MTPENDVKTVLTDPFVPDASKASVTAAMAASPDLDRATATAEKVDAHVTEIEEKGEVTEADADKLNKAMERISQSLKAQQMRQIQQGVGAKPGQQDGAAIAQLVAALLKMLGSWGKRLGDKLLGSEAGYGAGGYDPKGIMSKIDDLKEGAKDVAKGAEREQRAFDVESDMNPNGAMSNTR
ncbi:hypothetical protein ACYPKM_03475 [Pseudomonas aeruginosa]